LERDIFGIAAFAFWLQNCWGRQDFGISALLSWPPRGNNVLTLLRFHNDPFNWLGRAFVTWHFCKSILALPLVRVSNGISAR